jgi:hypothetical protein
MSRGERKRGAGRREGRKKFFFEKKNQKTFCNLGHARFTASATAYP